jgi:hypothetical protein
LHHFLLNEALGHKKKRTQKQGVDDYEGNDEHIHF